MATVSTTRIIPVARQPVGIAARMVYTGQLVPVRHQQQAWPGERRGTPADVPVEPDDREVAGSEGPRDEAGAGQASETSTGTGTGASGMAELLERLDDALAAVLESRRSAIRELQEFAVRMAVAVARAVTIHEVSVSTERIESLVQMAIERAGPREELVVQVSPEDLVRIEADPELLARLPGRIRWQADRSLQAGDVRIGCGAYGLESRVESRLEELQTRLLEGLQDAQAERRRAAGSGQSIGRFPDRRHGP